MRKAVLASAALLCLGLAATRPAAAQVDIINNLSNAVTTSFNSNFINQNAVHFKTDGTARDLIEIDLRLTASGGNGIVNLFSDDGTTTKPGSSLKQLTNNGQTGPASNGINTWNFTSSTTLTLAANTDYWVVIRSPIAPINVAWSFTSDAANSGAGSLPAQFRDSSANAGGSWTLVADSNNNHGIMEIKGSGTLSPTPVPAAPVVVLIGAAVFGLGMRKKRSQS